MKEILGVTNKLLEIDLSLMSWKIIPINPDHRKKFLGGKGLGLKLYYDRLKDKLNNVDPLGEENLLCFMAGVMTGTGGICSARFAGITKSPLTGIMVTASCGGPFGIALKTAGYDGLIIKGKSKTPIYLQISDEKVDFLDAADLWGSMIDKTQKALSISKKDGELVIGPAGENGVLFANIASGHRFLGRGGMGTVMGSKLLKAIVVRGRAYKVKPVKPEMFKKVRSRAAKYIGRNAYSKSYKQFGTNYNVLPGMEAGYAPVNNFKERTDPRLKNLS
ncbi:MAG: aldehyde ferredoxin oxidoreductase, partial [Deltaproteobacteria bacterium]|nr:aldehyde ferredoxin oxidoreductase [Deltaproteobacteria bacterium]